MSTFQNDTLNDLSIGAVCTIIGIPVPEGKVSFYAQCPRCGKKRLNINLAKNKFRCPVCASDDCSGGTIKLYALFKGISFKDAVRELKSQQYSDNKFSFIQTVPQTKQAEKLPPNKISSTYKAFLSKCVLLNVHKKDLLERGLTEEAIKNGMYKTVPHGENLKRIISELIAEGYQLLGVPGFYQDEETKEIRANVDFIYGYFVPVFSYRGHIKGMQIRLEKTKNPKKRYFWFSSTDLFNGCTCSGHVHFIGKKEVQKAYLTEGPLKATVASFLSGRTFIAIPGVNATSALTEFLSKLYKQGYIKTIVNTLDMDRYTNPNVAKAIEKIKEIVIGCGFKWEDCTWNPNFKGIDDYLLAKKKGRI